MHLLTRFAHTTCFSHSHSYIPHTHACPLFYNPPLHHMPTLQSCGGKPIAERLLSSGKGAANRGVIFMGPNHVEVKGIPFPELSLDSTNSPVTSERQTRKCNHGAILKVRGERESVEGEGAERGGGEKWAGEGRNGRSCVWVVLKVWGDRE